MQKYIKYTCANTHTHTYTHTHTHTHEYTEHVDINTLQSKKYTHSHIHTLNSVRMHTHLPVGSSLDSQCTSPSLSVIQGHTPSSNEQLTDPGPIHTHTG